MFPVVFVESIIVRYFGVGTTLESKLAIPRNTSAQNIVHSIIDIYAKFISDLSSSVPLQCEIGQ
jgi:hypothetical protein